MESAISKRSAEAFVEEQQQQGNLDAFGGSIRGKAWGVENRNLLYLRNPRNLWLNLLRFLG